MEKNEQTFILVKPDGIQRRLMGEIIYRFEKSGLKILAAKFILPSKELAEQHYQIHKGKPFYNGLITYITSGPVFAMVIEGRNAIQRVRKIVGATNPQEALPGTIRSDFCQHIGRNVVHASDSTKTAENEISLWFKKDEIIKYRLDDETWIYDY
jgi:nucleoside-diphosphate kinase